MPMHCRAQWGVALLGTLALMAALVLPELTVGPHTAANATAETAPPSTAAEQPNIVLILTDDMRADELRRMPNVRRLLVRNGTTYTNALSPHPRVLSGPRRAPHRPVRPEQRRAAHLRRGEHALEGGPAPRQFRVG